MIERDEEHLRLLSLFHFIVAGIIGFFSLLPLLHVTIGLLMVTGNFGQEDEVASAAGWLFVGVGLFAILVGMTFAVLLALAGRCLRRRRRHTFCLVVAAVSCLWIPLGTVLGVFTIVVLVRDSVRERFDSGPEEASLAT